MRFEESAEELYEEAPCGYLSALPGGEIIRVNRTLLTWTGHRREEVVGRRFQDLLTPGGRIYHETHYAPLLRMQGKVREIAVEIVRADGSRLPALINSVLKTDAEDKPLIVRTTVFNASDRKRYEQELLRARHTERSARERIERLQRLTSALAAALAPDEVARAVVRELAAGEALSVSFALLESAADELRVAATAGLAPGVRGRRVVPRPGGSIARALSDGAELFGPSGAVDDPLLAVFAAAEARSFAVLPLRVGQRSLGLVAIGLESTRDFDADERSFLAACAAQSAQALDRARLHAETAKVARRSAALAEASHELNVANSLAERADRLAQLLVPSVADAARVEVLSTSEDDPAVVIRAGPPDLVSRTEALELAEQALDTGTVLERTAPGTGMRYVALPLGIPGRSLGTLVVVQSGIASALTGLERRFLVELAERTGLALENARLYEQERSVARTLQESLLAAQLPTDPRFAVSTSYSPGVEDLEVGGDWYDAFPLPGERVAIVVGDVVGRGVRAATAMGQLRSAVRALAVASDGPAQLISYLDAFADPLEAGRMATLAYAEISLETGQMRYACAGHPPPVLLAPGAEPELLWDGRSTPLSAGAVRMPRTESRRVLDRGSRLVLYSDGLVERRDEPLDDGLARLARQFAARRDEPLAGLAERLAAAMAAGDGNRDDVCVLCCSFGEETGAGPPA